MAPKDVPKGKGGEKRKSEIIQMLDTKYASNIHHIQLFKETECMGH